MSVSSCHTSIVRDVLDGDCCCNCCWSNSCCCWLLLSTELDLEEEVQLCEWGQSFLRSPLFRSKQPISHSNTDLLEVVVGALGGGNTVGLSKRRDALFDERLIKHQSTTLHSMDAFMKHYIKPSQLSRPLPWRCSLRQPQHHGCRGRHDHAFHRPAHGRDGPVLAGAVRAVPREIGRPGRVLRGGGPLRAHPHRLGVEGLARLLLLLQQLANLVDVGVWRKRIRVMIFIE